MKTAFALASIACAAGSLSDPIPEPKPRPQVTQKMEIEFDRKSREAPSRPVRPSGDELDFVELAPIEVRAEDFHFVFDNEKRRLKSRPFTWKDGGTYLRSVGPKATTEWKFQYDPENNVIRLFSISF